MIQNNLTNLFLTNTIPVSKIDLMLSEAAAYNVLKAAVNLNIFISI